MSATPKNPDFDRKRVFQAAVDARGKGDRARAIELFKEIVANEPDDYETHGKLAQILAEHGDVKGALTHYRAGADGYHKKGFTDRAIALLKQAVEAWPLEVDAWLRMSEYYVMRKKRKDAALVLVEARRHFRKYPDLAAKVLDAHLALEPAAVDVAIDRAFVAKQAGQKGYGILLLTDLCSLVDAPERKRLRKALFSLKPTPSSFMRWWKNAPAT